MNWQKYWNRPLPSDNPLAQVDQTVRGQPIDQSQVEMIRESILTALKPEPGDHLLDLCCGNGYLTSQLAPHFERVYGADYSVPLYWQVAREHYQPRNVLYFNGDIRKPFIMYGCMYPCVNMYAGLQYFTAKDFQKALVMLANRVPSGARFFIGAVPDRARRWRFYNTPRRWLSWAWRSLRGRELIGHWWSRDELRNVLDHAEFDVEILEQPKGLYTAHYRFDALARRR